MHEELLNLCDFKDNPELVLLYRGSLHGFGAKDFHAKCDKKGCTLTVIKAAKSGYIFGGYTEARWQNYEPKHNGAKPGCVERDKSAFIFSLVNKEKKPAKLKIHHKFAVYHSSQCGPCFGAIRHDIYIGDNSNLGNKNYSSLNVRALNKRYCFEESKSFLAGSHRFAVEDIEVFRVKY